MPAGPRWLLPCCLSLVASACSARAPRPAPVAALDPASFTQRAASPEPTRTDAQALTAAAPRTRAIDLATALEIGGADSLQVALAHEDLALAEARLDQAEVLWLPDLWVGVEYRKHEGALQETEGDILRVSRNSGFIGGGLFASFELADAMLEPGSARHDVDAARADVSSRVNDTLLGIALAFNDLAAAQARLDLVEESVSSAAELVELAEAFARSGQGLEADASRARSELARRRLAQVAARQSIETQSVRLATLLRLDTSVQLRAAGERFAPIVLIPGDIELERLIDEALALRPELRSLESLVEAEAARERQENLRPFIPRLDVGVSGGGLGGGTGSDFEDFSEQGELGAALTWGVRNLGFGESAARRYEAAQTRRVKIRLALGRDAVVEQVTVAFLEAREGRSLVELAAQSVAESLGSLDLNLRRIRGAEGLPVEALQAIQAAASAQEAHLAAVAEFNRTQLRLLRAVGRAPRP